MCESKRFTVRQWAVTLGLVAFVVLLAYMSRESVIRFAAQQDRTAREQEARERLREIGSGFSPIDGKDRLKSDMEYVIPGTPSSPRR